MNRIFYFAIAAVFSSVISTSVMADIISFNKRGQQYYGTGAGPKEGVIRKMEPAALHWQPYRENWQWTGDYIVIPWNRISRVIHEVDTADDLQWIQGVVDNYLKTQSGNPHDWMKHIKMEFPRSGKVDPFGASLTLIAPPVHSCSHSSFGEGPDSGVSFFVPSATETYARFKYANEEPEKGIATKARNMITSWANLDVDIDPFSDDVNEFDRRRREVATETRDVLVELLLTPESFRKQRKLEGRLAVPRLLDSQLRNVWTLDILKTATWGRNLSRSRWPFLKSYDRLLDLSLVETPSLASTERRINEQTMRKAAQDSLLNYLRALMQPGFGGELLSRSGGLAEPGTETWFNRREFATVYLARSGKIGAIEVVEQFFNRLKAEIETEGKADVWQKNRENLFAVRMLNGLVAESPIARDDLQKRCKKLENDLKLLDAGMLVIVGDEDGRKKRTLHGVCQSILEGRSTPEKE